jgi:hypothetical protein
LWERPEGFFERLLEARDDERREGEVFVAMDGTV